MGKVPRLTTRTNEPRITALSAETPALLHLIWVDGSATEHDLSETLASKAWAAPLLDPAVFRSARIEDDGWQIVWPDTEVAFSAAGLWEDAHPRPAAPAWMSAEQFAGWMREMGYSFASAAQALDVSPRMLKYYTSGTNPVPKTVWLACMQLASQRYDRSSNGDRMVSR